MTEPTAPPEAADRLCDESFLERWSRRKLQGREQAIPETELSPPALENPLSQAAGPAPDADLPPIDSLGEHSDYRGFLSPRVSQELRTLALRKLFHLPRYQTRCILNEYEGNFNDFRPLGGVVTHEMRRLLELEAQRRLAEAVTEGPPADSDPPSETPPGEEPA